MLLTSMTYPVTESRVFGGELIACDNVIVGALRNASALLSS